MDKNGGKNTDGTPDALRKKAKPSMEQPTGDHDEERVWMDPNALSVDCGICFMPFEAQVFMQRARCLREMLPPHQPQVLVLRLTNRRHCRPAEKMLAEMNTFCKNSRYGCVEILKFVNKRRHEETCRHAPTGCPVAGCGYLGKLEHLHRHLLDDHADVIVTVAGLKAMAKVSLRKSDPFRVLVMEGSTQGVFLLVNGGGVLAGRSLSLVCLGPRRPEGEDVETRYKMEVHGGEPGVIWMKGTAPCVRRLEGFEANKFLFVPDADWGLSGSVSVSIRIG